jgi:hypothetical protein
MIIAAFFVATTYTKYGILGELPESKRNFREVKWAYST